MKLLTTKKEYAGNASSTVLLGLIIWFVDEGLVAETSNIDILCAVYCGVVMVWGINIILN